MTTRETAIAVTDAAAAGAAAVLGSYAWVGVSSAYVVAPVERFLARTIPGPAVTLAILVLGDSGRRLNLAVATGLTAVAFGLLAFVAQLFGRAVAARWRSGHGSIVAVLLALAGSWVLGTLLSGASHGAAGAALGAAVVIVAAELARYPEPPGPADDSRRRLLASVTVAGVFGVGSYLLGSRRSGVTSVTGDDRGAGSASRATGALLASAFNQLYSLGLAMEEAGSTETDAVIDALEGLTFDSPMGELSYRESDHQTRLNFIGDVVEGGSLTTLTQYPDVIGEAFCSV